MPKSFALIFAVAFLSALICGSCSKVFRGDPSSELDEADLTPEETVIRQQFYQLSTNSLIESLRDEDPYIRYYAAQTLGFIGDRDAVLPLASLLDDEDELVRSCAAHSLGLLGSERAIEPLVRSLRDKEFSVRLEASKALENLGWTPAVSTDAERVQTIKQEEEARTRIGTTTINPLVSALTSRNRCVRIKAAKLLDQYDWKPDNEEQNICYIIAKGEVTPSLQSDTYLQQERQKKESVQDTHTDYERTFITVAQEPARAAIAAGRMQISIMPKMMVTIIIDGKEYIETDGVIVEIPTGRHTMEALDPAYNYYAEPLTVTIKKNKTKKVTFDMKNLFPPISNAIIIDLAEEHFKGRDIKNIKVLDVWRMSKTRCLASISFSYVFREIPEWHYTTGYVPDNPLYTKDEPTPILFLSLEGFTLKEREWKIVKVYLSNSDDN